MNPIRIIHTADIHFDRENQGAALQSLETLYQHGWDHGVDLWVVAGDLFNRAVQNTASSGFPRLIEALQRMMDLAPVVAVQGTPTHDITGCYEALQEINAEHSFTLLDPRRHYFLSQTEVFDSRDLDGDLLKGEPWELLILGCPEPSKEWFLAGKDGLSREKATQAVIVGMRELLLGFAAHRKQHADIPCLFVYHGSVEGASLCNGQLLPQGEIAIGRDDLAMIGADYYALGHIHLAQQVGTLPAYYAGSAFPVNWGEIDRKSFCAVRFEGPLVDRLGYAVHLERVPYPHPPRKKVQLPYGSEPRNYDVAGSQVWLEIRATKQQAAMIKPESVLTELLSAGALEGSRVTVSVLPTETVRAGEIGQAAGLGEKLAIYVRNSSEEEEVPDRILEKAELLEAEARAAGLTTEGLHIRIRSLKLRGAIGIWKGLGQDEIFLDLERYDSGLIALVGENGRGKTTLIENMHPYSEMLTRPGKLQDHFRLRDSSRDLYFTDERTGSAYRALILIDGQNPSGKAEYHLYRDGKPLTNGRKEEYEAKVEELFGSLSLFVRSAFVSQKPPKNHPDLTDATKGEKKALFRELAGLDYLQGYSEAAKEKAKALEAETERDQGRIGALEELLAGASTKEDELTELEVERQEASERLEKLEDQGRAAKAEVEELRQKVERQGEIRRQLAELEDRSNRLGAEAIQIAEAREGYEAAVAGRQEAEKRLAEWQAFKDEEGALREQQTDILRRREQLQSEYRDAEKAVANRRAEIEARTAETARKVAIFQQKKEHAISRVDELTARLATQVECPACHHRFHPDAAGLQAQLEAAQKSAFALDKDLAALVREAESVLALAAIADPPVPQLPTFDDTRLRAIAGDLAFLDAEAARKTLAAAQEATVRLEEGRKREAQLREEQKRLDVQRVEASGQLAGPELEEAYRLKQDQLVELETLYRNDRDRLKSLEASIAALAKQLEDLAERQAELAELQVAVETKRQDAYEWRYLERACGPDGIQALELDAMGPGIAEVANRLLAAAYGSRFQIEFRTTRIGGAGSKRKQIEDFQIWIFDSEHGTEQLLETLSGGESVWVKRAIYDAFGIIRDRSTGQRFLTAFQDEADGALDPEARLAYFRMLQAAHQESGRDHTLVITHSAEAQEMIGQRIRMEELAAAREEVIA